MPPYKRAGCYIVKSAEGRAHRVEGRVSPPGYTPPQPTKQDRSLVRALLAHREGEGK